MSLDFCLESEPAKLCHLTFVVNELLPVFSHPQIVRHVMDSWIYQRRNNGMKFYGYVVMEEHLHFMAQADRLDLCLIDFMEQTSEQIFEYLVEQQLEKFLCRLLVGKDFRFWQGQPEIEEIPNDDMMLEILEYIHINPVKRGYVDRPEQWRYSSARNYSGEAGLIEIDKWQ